MYFHLPPASSREGIRQPKGAQDIGGDEIEDGAGGSSPQGSGSVGPFVIGDGHALLAIRDVQARYVDSLHRTCLKFLQVGNNIGEKVLSHLGRRESLLLFAAQTGVVVVFLEGDTGIVETAQAGRNGLADTSGFVAIVARLMVMLGSAVEDLLRVIHGLCGPSRLCF